MANDSERLFLMEVLVDKVVVEKSGSLMERLKSQNDWGTGELCVTFQFLDYPHLEICEKDFSTKAEESSDTKTSFKSGKSCLFAIPNSQLNDLPEEFALNVGVLRKMPVGVLPDKLLIAQTKIELIEPVCSVIKESNCNHDVPVSKTVKDCFALMDPSGMKTVGSICVFVRFTCCGRAIVTQFQLGDETEQATLFKGNESDKVYQFTNMDDVATNGAGTCHPMCPWLHRYQKMQQQCGCCSCSEPPLPPTPPPTPPSCCCTNTCDIPPATPPSCCCCSHTCGILQPPPPLAAVGGGGECYCCDGSSAGGECKPKLYEEIGAEINGHALTIRVKKDTKRKLGDDEFGDEICCPSKEYTCCEPSPPCPKGSSLEIRPWDVKDAGGFSLKFPQKGSQHLCYKLRECPREQQQSQHCGNCVVPTDYDQEAFVLRIAKDRKSHLEFELKTPKKKGPESPITTENRETQYLTSDLRVSAGKRNDKKTKKKRKH